MHAGKTTLSADPHRPLIGDDEHCWTEDGISNLEGGCYAKCINLSAEKEPDIFHAIRSGAVLENVVADANGVVDYDDTSLTQNTRAAYPVEHIENANIPCVGPHPKNLILLCCDAFGILPPVARLSRAQTMYHFVSGYTAKVAGTEMGTLSKRVQFNMKQLIVTQDCCDTHCIRKAAVNRSHICLVLQSGLYIDCKCVLNQPAIKNSHATLSS